MQKVFHVFGSGGIGQAAILMLEELYSHAQYHVYDRDFNLFDKTYSTTIDSLKARISQHAISMPDHGLSALKGHFVLDCMPGKFAPMVAALAHENDINYINLTEYVKETELIKDAAVKHKDIATILQSGVAPGFVNLIGQHLVKSAFAVNTKVELYHLQMKVGALPTVVQSPSQYAFTWSTIGVATEYVQDALAVVDHQLAMIPSVDQIDSINLNGVAYECAATSGGVADMGDAYKEQIAAIDYQTIRHPGHFGWIKAKLAHMEGSKEDKITALHEWMLSTIPHVKEDKVLIYASLSYRDQYNRLMMDHCYYEVPPATVNGLYLKGIQLSTAIPMVATIDWVLQNNIKGLVTQSMIDEHFIISHSLVKKYFRVID